MPNLICAQVFILKTLFLVVLQVEDDDIDEEEECVLTGQEINQIHKALVTLFRVCTCTLINELLFDYCWNSHTSLSQFNVVLLW